MYKARTAAGFNPLSKPLTPAEYATLHTSARAKASWLLKDHAAQLDREIEEARAKLATRQSQFDGEIFELRSKVRQRRYNVRRLTERLNALDGEHEIRKRREETLLAEAEIMAQRARELTAAVKAAPRVRGVVSARELAAIEANAEEQLAARRLEEASAERYGSGTRHGHPSHAKSTNRFFREPASA